MRTRLLIAVAGVLALGGCGSPSAAASMQNAFTGTLSITSALPAGVTTCQATQTVTFTAAGVDVHAVTSAGGGCIRFLNSDTANHQPASIGTPACPELDAPGPLATGGSFTAGPLSGPKTCNWEDSLNPPGSPGGGGPGY